MLRSCLTLGCVLAGVALADAPFRITAVDGASGRGVPLVELRTTDNVSYWTDSAGVIALDAPELMGRETWFEIHAHGYRYPADGLGLVGVRLTPRPGEAARVELERVNVAERLYRVTGAGVYHHSRRLGDAVPLGRPALLAELTGCDSVQAEVYRGRLTWVWGDANRLSYALGNFKATGARSWLPGAGGADPALGVELEYFTRPDGFARELCAFGGGEPGPVWLDGLVSVRDAAGREHLVAHFVRVKSLGEVYARGLARFDDASGTFKVWRELPLDAPLAPRGHALRVSVDGVDYLYFADPLPDVRVRATLEALGDPAQYEGFSMLVPGAHDPAAPRFDRDPEGRLRLGWKRGAHPLRPAEQLPWVGKGLAAEEVFPRLRAPEQARLITPHRGSVQPDPGGGWTWIFTEAGGESSHLGEVWFARAPSPLGPWAFARKVVTHDRYSFYNPTQHEYFSDERWLYFEGTYTTLFAGTERKTPRYDYNQILYRLDRRDPRLRLPVPCGGEGERAAAFAWSHPAPGTVPLALPGGREAWGYPANAPPPFPGMRLLRVAPGSGQLQLAPEEDPGPGCLGWAWAPPGRLAGAHVEPGRRPDGYH
ncbi:MAG: hypothetical protein KDD82_08405 [Planctomycetes bacterium]|nr:hypothetical protein [Planctomycetota bacterium]